MTQLSSALTYLSRGFSVIPVRPDKTPFIKWEEFQKRRPTEDEIRQWWAKWPNAMIGIVTGSISGIDIMDTDSQEADEEFQGYLSDSLICPTQRTPGGGRHYLFAHAEGIRNSNDRSPFKFHVRGEGGYFIAAPSENGNGGRYQWLDGLSIEEVDPPPMPNTLYNSLINVLREGERNFKTSEEEHTKAHESTREHKILTLGRRDNDLFHAANALINARTPIEEVEQYLEILAENSNPPFPLSEISEKIKSALKRVERRDRNITQEVREWVESTGEHNESTGEHTKALEGTFDTGLINRELQITTKEGFHAVNTALRRLIEEGVIERWGDKRGVYRRIERECDDIDFLNASRQTIDIKWPLGIERHIITLPKNVMVIAGSKDAGKTAFLLNLVRLNMKRFSIHYFSSEMGRIELRKRLEKFDLPLEDWTFKPKERSKTFADVIQPDDINVIDYLEVSEDFYRVGGMLREIYEKLNQGIAIVALQKNKGRDTGVGGDRSLEKPRLYLSLEGGKAKIIVGKNWTSEVNPVGLHLDFKLVQGCKFIIQKDWYRG
jgi:hypothetical protein